MRKQILSVFVALMLLPVSVMACTLYEVSISDAFCDLEWEGGTHKDCEPGERIFISYTVSGNCTDVDWIQINAVSNDNLCSVSYDGDVRGIGGVGGIPAPGVNYYLPDIPIPAVCSGKTVYANYGALYDGGPPGTGSIMTSTTNASGSFKFAPTTLFMPQPVGPIPLINATEWQEAGYGWALPLLSPFFIYTFIIALLSTISGFISKDGRAIPIVGFILIIVFVGMGLYPFWIGVVFIIISGLIVAKIVRDAVVGGGG